MNNLEKRLASLTPRQRKLLDMKLGAKQATENQAGSVIKHRQGISSYPLSHAQRSLWLIDQLDPGNPVYNIAMAIRLEGKLDADALNCCMRQIVDRHEAMRTCYRLEEGQPMQVVMPCDFVQADVIDLTHLPEHERLPEAERRAQTEAKRPFVLEKGPMFRASLIRLGDTDHVLVMTVHHIAFDAWSMGVLLQEFAELYLSYAQGTSPQLSETPIRYGDYVLWRQEWLQGESARRQLDYWENKLKHVPPYISIPTDRSPPIAPSYEGSRLAIQLPNDVATGIRAIGRTEGATVYMILLAAWSVLLYRYCGQEEMAISSPIAGRRQETEKSIGFFVNTLIMGLNLGGNPTFREYLSNVRTTSLEAFSNQEVPYEMVIEKLGIRHQGSAPFAQVKFIYQNVPGLELHLPNLKISYLSAHTDTAKFNLMLDLTETSLGIGGRIEYSTTLFDRHTIEKIAQQWFTLLRSIIRNPNEHIQALEITSEEEKREMIKLDKMREESKRQKLLMKSKPKAIRISSAQLVTTRLFAPEQTLPLIIEPAAPNMNVIEWIATQKEDIAQKLVTHGGVLFRGFDLSSIEQFDQFTRTLSPELLDYKERSTPRSEMKGNIYTSTEYPKDQFIPMHSEMSYSANWPKKIWFYSVNSAAEGGETPIADNRKVFARIDPEIREKFMDKQVMYVRNFGEGLDIPWQDVFQTNDRQEVERYCSANHIEFEWKPGGGLRTRQVRQAVARHPVTNEWLWFNQAHLFHVSNLPQEVLQSLVAVVDEADLPRNTYYGDGSPIEEYVLEEIREAFRLESIAFPWQDGDILMLDNMMIAHGRHPFNGERKVAVAMAELFNEPSDILEKKGAFL